MISRITDPAVQVGTAVVHGCRVEDIEAPSLPICYQDKLMNELAKGRAMEKILRK